MIVFINDRCLFVLIKTIQYVDDMFLITRFKMRPDWQAQNLVTDFRRYAIILIGYAEIFISLLLKWWNRIMG